MGSYEHCYGVLVAGLQLTFCFAVRMETPGQNQSLTWLEHHVFFEVLKLVVSPHSPIFAMFLSHVPPYETQGVT